MGTPGAIAVPHEDTWRGRYVHWDGDTLGREVWAIVQRDGLEAAAKKLIDDRYAWSSIDADQPDFAGVTPNPEAKIGSAEWQAYLFKMKDDGRFANEPGYGVAYTTETGTSGQELPQSDPDEWVSPVAGNVDAEYAFVLDVFGMSCWSCSSGNWVRVTSVAWSDDPDWSSIETALHEAR